MSSDRRAFFDDNNRDVGVQRFEANGRREAGRSRADDHDIVTHRLPRRIYRLLAHDTSSHRVLASRGAFETLL
jgi:hypothetical protein